MLTVFGEYGREVVPKLLALIWLNPSNKYVLLWFPCFPEAEFLEVSVCCHHPRMRDVVLLQAPKAHEHAILQWTLACLFVVLGCRTLLLLLILDFVDLLADLVLVPAFVEYPFEHGSH